MLLGASLLRGSHCGSNCTGENGGGCGRHALPHDDDGMPLIMPFVQGILFGMHLVNSKETQVVCGGAHPCCEGRTVVAIVMETMAALAAATTIKEVGGLSSCYVFLDLGHRLSF
jgi:hypothetical protein